MAGRVNVSSGNAWISSYLDALLSFGLSSEYAGSTREGSSSKAPDADRVAFSRYYVNSLLAMDEEALHYAWMQAASAKAGGGEKDARLQYLSWRIWFMKRKHARVQREEHDRRAAEAAEEGSVLTEPTSGYSSDEEGEPKTPAEFSAAASATPSTRPSPRTSAAEAKGKAEVTDVAPLPAAGEAPAPAGGEAGAAAAVAAAAAAAAGAAAGPFAGTALSLPSKPHKALQVRTGAAQEFSLDAGFEGLLASPWGTPAAPALGFEGRLERLYVVLISLHGLVRGEEMELGKDADTGGQVKYVVELAKAISLHPAVHRVDLLTRLIRDPKVDASYGEPEECLRRGGGEHGGAYIVRLPCGPTHKYVRKELLWPYVREFADRGIAYTTSILSAMAEGGRRCELYVVHGHYADAGEAAVLMASTLAVNMCMTGHSLGRNKLEHLLASGTMTRAEIEESYAITRRIEGEEKALDAAVVCFTSTQQEIDEQWGLYDGFSPQLSRVLKHSHGRHMPTLRVIPPGLDFSNLKVSMPEDPVLREFEDQRRAMEVVDISAHATPHLPLSPHEPEEAAGGAAAAIPPSPRASPHASRTAGGGVAAGASTSGGGGAHNASAGGDVSLPSTPGTEAKLVPSGFQSPRQGPSDSGSLPMIDPLQGPPMWKEIARFLRNPLKPAILAMSRADPKKNVATLVKAFGQHTMLRELANLVLIMGNRENIDGLPSGSQKVMTQVLKLIDTYDLYGSVAYPKHHTQADISDIYLFCRTTRGVFVNIALQEPFGLTVIEAAAHGVPTVATKNGGPVDIMATLFHGVIVDPTDADAVAAALLGILTHPKTWDQMSANGTNNIMAYSWPSHVKKYLDAIEAERRFERSHKKHGRTLSGLMDRRTLVPAEARGEEHYHDAVATAASGLSSGTGADLLAAGSPAPSPGDSSPMMTRFHSMPPPMLLGKEADAAPVALGIRKTISGMSTDDLALLQTVGPEALARAPDSEPCGALRHRLVAVQLDSDATLPQFLAALRGLIEQRREMGLEGEVGLGVLSMLGFDSTREHIEGVGLSMSQLDFTVCNSGADVWHQLQDGSWDADEGYESLVDFEWDRIALHRTLLKVVSQPDEERQTSRRLPRLKELLYNVQEAPTGGVHPRHICLELDEATQNILAAGMGPRRGAYAARGAKITVAAMERLRRRMRSRGFRATYTLQQVPRDATATGTSSAHQSDFLSVLHITPLRASRPLALRFLAHKFQLGMNDVSLVALVPEFDTDRQLAATYVTDGLDLIAGQQRVVVLPEAAMPAGEGGAAGGAGTGAAAPYSPLTRVLLESQGVPLEPYMWEGGTRMVVADGEGFAAAALAPPPAEGAEA